MSQRGFRGNRYLTEEEKAAKPKVTKELLFRIAGYLKPYAKQMILVLLLIAFSSMLSLYPSIITGRIIDEGLIKQDMGMLIKLILLSLFVTIGAQLINVLQSYLNSWIAQHITFDMRNQMFKHLQSMSHRFFTTNNQGDIITRMTSDISGVQSIMTNTLVSILSNSITLVTALAAMFQKNALLAVIGIIIVPLFTLPTKAVGKTRWEITNEAQQCHDEINGILNETLSVSGQLLVKLFNKEEREYHRYESINRKMVQLNIKESMAGRWFRLVLSTFATIGPMLIYLVGGILMMKYDSSLTVGDITVLVALLGKMYQPVNSLLNFSVDWIRSMSLFQRIFDYFDMEVEIKNCDHPVILDDVQGSIEFKDVCFHYNPDRQILKNINFTLSPGKSIAIVGPSGSGKSTIINLIPRIYDVISGEVLFDGVDVRKLDLSFLRDQIGLVSQETYLFNGTIKENLLYANEKATDDMIIEACKKANIHDFISKQPEGYNTMVGNRGLKLSGGEKQRLSIARVLLKDPTILIFDEATSSLDSISEDLIQSAIDPLISSKTSIIIAHRLSTVLAADEILVLKEGQIVERGQHQQLVELNGTYTELYETQFKRALEKIEMKSEETMI
ncbi:MAG: ABC transporter ATP-binding protein [Erysipelotrichaceae bacterium]|nr:ABC transporter ATP-binding protein [Erysipelotrichaceae bacterium]